MMNEPCHINQMDCALKFINSPLDGSTTQSWVVRFLHVRPQTHAHMHKNPSTYTFTSDNKDACRCFHESELYYTASVLHEKETDIEMERRCCIFVVFFFPSTRMCLCAVLCECQRKHYQRVRESGSQQRPVRASLHQQASCLRYYPLPTQPTLLYLDFLQLAQCTSHSGCLEGSGLPSAPADPSLVSQFGEEVINFVIYAKLLCHLGRACCWEGERELIKMLSAHIDSLFYAITQPAACVQINK